MTLRRNPTNTTPPHPLGVSRMAWGMLRGMCGSFFITPTLVRFGFLAFSHLASWCFFL